MNIMKKALRKIQDIKDDNPIKVKQTKVTIIDNKLIKIENYTSIDTISDNEIATDSCKICGDNLVITYMSKKLLDVKGIIKEVNFPYKH